MWMLITYFVAGIIIAGAFRLTDHKPNEGPFAFLICVYFWPIIAIAGAAKLSGMMSEAQIGRRAFKALLRRLGMYESSPTSPFDFRQDQADCDFLAACGIKVANKDDR